MFKFSKEIFNNNLLGLISVLLIEAIYFYNFTTPEFNVNVCQLPFWSLTVYFSWKIYNEVSKFVKGTWNDFIIKANYSRERIKGEKYFELWWNGKQIDECTHYIPFVNSKHIKESKSHGWSSNKQQINMRYGIYKFRLGDYLTHINKNKPKNMKTMTQPSGQKNIIKPFKYDWENKIPTTVMLFDEIRFGKSYSDVGN